MRSIRKTLLATSCALALAGPASATIVTEAFDGAWTDPRAVGQNKGLMVDVLPDQNTFFGAFFTYANDGSQVWSIVSTQLVDGQNDYTNVPVLRFSGGRFSEAGSPTSETIGTASLGFSCDGIVMDVTPAAGSSLTPASFTFVPSLGLKKLTSEQCNDVAATCPAGTTAAGNDCQLPNQITNDLFLPAGKKYIVRGAVFVEDGGTMTVAPGVTVEGSTDTSSPNFIGVKIGGRIYAEGTREQPITFTGPEEVPGSWAGLVLNGRSICNDATATQRCQFEAVPELEFGQVPPVLDDSSGSLRYVRILWAGQQIAPDEELNSLTMNGVGAGTTIEYVQVDGGLDDGFEWFGGNVDGRYLVSSNMGDDMFDCDDGYAGRIQFALGWQGDNPDHTNDSNGIECDNSRGSPDIQPRTKPIWSNMTLVGTGDNIANEGIRIRRGSGANLTNLVVTGFTDTCINLDDAPTFALSTAAQGGNTLTMTHSWVGSCGVGQFEDNSSDAYAVSAWYNAGTGNGLGDPQITNFLPNMGSPLVSGGKAPSDPWFRPSQYRGAFAGPRDNWTSGWTVNIPR